VLNFCKTFCRFGGPSGIPTESSLSCDKLSLKQVLAVVQDININIFYRLATVTSGEYFKVMRRGSELER
jgi:hypothetical protein